MCIRDRIDRTSEKHMLMGLNFGSYVVTSVAHPGESYYSTDGTTWEDLYEEDPSANFCIKALTLPEPCDSNNDHVVDAADLATWQQHYDPLGNHINTFGKGDWNLDGLVDGADLALWQQMQDPLGTWQTIPEPGTLLLLGVGLLMLGPGRCTRRK